MGLGVLFKALAVFDAQAQNTQGRRRKAHQEAEHRDGFKMRQGSFVFKTRCSCIHNEDILKGAAFKSRACKEF